MLKDKLPPFFFLLISFLSFAQRPSGSYGSFQKATIEGRVIDKETKQALEYATITFTNKRNSSLLQGGITDNNGVFKVDVFPGMYDVSFDFIGFESFKKESIMIKGSMDLGEIGMVISVDRLEGVELMAERTEVEIRLDKRIYNVGKDITVRGGSVADVLDNVPSVSVDVEGNVSLRGNSSVRILINGKPSGLVGLSGPQGLQQLPAESIEKVEVITSPSARYDSEGTGGILNIILRKQELLGVNGNFVANIGFPKTFGGSASVNFRNDKYNIFTVNSIRQNRSKGFYYNDNEYFNGDDPSTFLEEERKPLRDNRSLFTNLGVEFYLKENTSLILSGFFRDRKGDSETKNDIKQSNYLKDILSRSNRVEKETDDDKSYQFSANFDSEIDDKGQKITLVAQYEKSTEDEDGSIENKILFPIISELNFETVQQYEDQTRTLLQGDYVLPIDENTQFELGYRGSFLNQETDYEVAYLDQGTFRIDNNLSNVLLYKQYINAAYTQYGKKIDKFSYLLGLRMENSNITIDQKTTNDYNLKKYTDWFPTINLSYEFDESKSITLGYSRRLRRPWSRFLNPFPSRSSITNIFQGNPDLDPSYSNAYDFGYLKRWDKFTLNGSIYFQRSTSVYQFITINTGETVVISGDRNDPGNPVVEVPVIKRTPVNLAEEKRYGAEFNLSYTPSKKVRLNGNFNLFSSELIGEYDGVDFGAKNMRWYTRINSTIRLPGKIDWQLRMRYSGPSENSQTKSSGSFVVSGALNKDFLKDKATISFRASDIFNSGRRISETRTPNFYGYGEFQWRTPTYIFTITYRLNQKKYERRRGENQNYNTEEAGSEFDI
ncbi:MAG: TonB-dependent receptor [Bacteroidota bacterium]|nr:TonB-dependent receptor [Bacteroidota bacterium]